MILLDTNVISALMQRSPEPQILAWLDSQYWPSIWTTSVAEMEIRCGIEALPSGRRREELARAFEKLLRDIFEERIAAFDSGAARRAATLVAERRKRGRTVEVRDSMIAGIALALGATLATRNVSHFDDARIEIVNPWQTRKQA
jgi:toxin FitB